MNQNSYRSYFLLTFLILILMSGLVALTWANYRFAEQSPGGNDFLARWMGAYYWVEKGISPYDPEVSLATQQAIYGHPADVSKGEDKNHFVYPLHSMLFFAPFGAMEYTLARALWMTVLEISLVALAIVSLKLARWETGPLKTALLILFSVLWYHGIRTIIIGQFAGIDALLIVLALFLIMKNHDVGAGVLLALSTAKPQMIYLLIPFVLLWSYSARRRELFWSILLTGFVLLLASLVLLPSWPLQWLGQMLDYPSYTSRIGSPLSVIADTMPGISRPLSLFFHGVAYLYLLIEWFFAWGKNERWFLWTALMTIVITNLVAYRTATTNFVMMLPALFLIFRIWEERWKSGGKYLFMLSIFFLSLGLWAMFLITVEGNLEQPLMYLPLPFFCMIGLWWVRWWYVRPPKVLLEQLIERV